MRTRPTRRARAVLAATLAAGLVGVSACTGQQSESGGIAEVSAVNDASAYEGVEFTPPVPRPEFTLTDQTGAAYDFHARTQGIPTILYFGYTHCPDVCPLIMGQIAYALQETEPDIRNALQVVLVTTDPANDTPEALGAYVSKFDGELPVKFVGLTGDLAAVEAAQAAAGVPVAEDGGKTHSTLAIYYGTSDVSHVAWLANSSYEDIVHDLPIGVK